MQKEEENHESKIIMLAHRMYRRVRCIPAGIQGEASSDDVERDEEGGKSCFRVLSGRDVGWTKAELYNVSCLYAQGAASSRG